MGARPHRRERIDARHLGALLLAATLGMGGIFTRAITVASPDVWLVAIAAATAVAVALSLELTTWASRTRSMLAGTALVVLAGASWHRGVAIPTAVVAATTVLAYGAVVRWCVPRRWPRRSPGLVIPAVAVIVVLDVESYRQTASRWTVVLGVVALAVLEVAARRPMVLASVDRGIRRGAEGFGRALATVLSLIVMGVVVLPFHAMARLVRYSPLDGGWRSRPTAWLTVEPGAAAARDAEHLGANERRPTRTVRWRGRAAALIPLVVVLALIAIVVAPDRMPWRRERGAASTVDPFEAPIEDRPAFADVPWARDLRLDLLDAWRNLRFNAASGGWSLRDITSDYVNVHDGERTSTAPDPALGTPLEVWFFGGSAAFGAGQRDQHTIASELVRLAGSDGIPVRVRNLAVPATVDWQSATLLLERLAWGGRPDLVVFYDGANDLALQSVLAGEGRARFDRPASLVDAQLDRAVRDEAKASDSGQGALPTPDEERPDVPTTPEEAGRIVLQRYQRGVELARRACDDLAIPVAFFWQPDLRAKSPLTDDDLDVLRTAGIDESSIGDWAASSDVVRAGLDGAGVHDLSSIFDGRSDTVYWDSVHTNEVGARVAATAIYRELSPRLAQLASAS